MSDEPTGKGFVWNNPLTWGIAVECTINIAVSFLANTVFAGLPTVFSGIVWVLKIVFAILSYILFTIVPFLVQYIGIPLFILGIIMGIMFMGGHILFVILFIIGLAFYIKGLLNIKLVNSKPDIANNLANNVGPPQAK